MVVRASQSFYFFRQNTWFLENNGALPKFSYDIFLNVISINLKKSIFKNQFYINDASHLKVERETMKFENNEVIKFVHFWMK